MDENWYLIVYVNIFVGFEKVCDSTSGGVLFSILTEFCTPMKLDRLIKMCLRETSEPGWLGGKALGYGLDDRGVRFPAGAGNFSLHHRVQTGSGAHPASYPMDARDSFPGVKAAGA
jgi:hypothetical protein